MPDETPYVPPDSINHTLREDPFAWVPISQMIGLEVQPASPSAAIGTAEIFLNVDARMHNPMGSVHGGIIALLADAAMGIAFGRTLNEKHFRIRAEGSAICLAQGKVRRASSELNVALGKEATQKERPSG